MIYMYMCRVTHSNTDCLLESSLPVHMAFLHCLYQVICLFHVCVWCIPTGMYYRIVLPDCTAGLHC